ncbi:MAG: hypothetical protein AAGJ81_10755 [Verrucomicrobiota bacterium]
MKVKEPIVKGLTHRYTGRSGATVGVGSVVALLASDPAQPTEQDLLNDPPAIVLEAAPKPEPVFVEAMPVPATTQVEQKVRETEIAKDGELRIYRSFEMVDGQAVLEEYQDKLAVWGKNVISNAEATATNLYNETQEFLDNPVFVETNADVQELQQHVGAAAAVVQRILDRAATDPIPVLGALVGALLALFSNPKSEPKKTNE